jgi:hypothetical protein
MSAWPSTNIAWSNNEPRIAWSNNEPRYERERARFPGARLNAP